MIPTKLRHLASCQTEKKPVRIASKGVVIYRCPGCGATATSTRSSRA